MRSHLEAACDPGPHGEARCGSEEPAEGGKRGGRCQDAAAQGYHSTTTHSVRDTSRFHIITWPAGQASVTGREDPPLSVQAILVWHARNT